MSADKKPEPPGLPPEIREALFELRSRYPTTKALMLPALHLAQRHWGGWLPDEAIEAVALELEVSPAEVFGVVTFYDLYHQRPVGRHRVRVCTNVSCMLRGAEDLIDALSEKLDAGEDQVTADGRCSYTQFECLGACEHAPMAMIDDSYHYDLTPEKILEIVEGLD